LHIHVCFQSLIFSMSLFSAFCLCDLRISLRFD
jgi:hypothetical protein